MASEREAESFDGLSPGDRTRRRWALMGVLLIVVGQAAAIWPFDKITVYKSAPDHLHSIEMNIVAITPDGEQDAVRTGGVGYRIVRLHRIAYQRARTATERERVLSKLCDCVARANPVSLQLRGVRLYNLTWDLDDGQIVRSELVDEYLRPTQNLERHSKLSIASTVETAFQIQKADDRTIALTDCALTD